MSVLTGLTPTSLLDETVLARTDIVGVDVDAHLMCSHITHRRVQTLVDVHALVSASLWVNAARPTRLEVAQLVAAVVALTVPVVARLSVVACAVAAQEPLV